MDDSLFLPQDIMEIKDSDKCFSDLRRSLLNLGRVFSESYDRRDPTVFKEFEKELVKRLDNLGRSMGNPKYDIADDIEVEFVSNMAIPVEPMLDRLDTFLSHRLDHVSLAFDQHYYFGLTKNMDRYIASTYQLAGEQIEDLRSKGKYFVYDQNSNDLFIFKREILPTVLKHLIYKGEDVEIFYLLKKMQTLLK